MANRFLSRRNKGQVAIEFIVLIAVMFTIFVVFLAVATNKVLDAREQERKDIAHQIGTLAQQEISLALIMNDGYTRSFSLPQKVQGFNYSIELIDNRELIVAFVDQEYVAYLPEGLQGTVQKGTNTIRKENKIIYLNS